MTARVESSSLRRLHTIPSVRKKSKLMESKSSAFVAKKSASAMDVLQLEGMSGGYTSMRDLLTSTKANEIEYCDLKFRDPLVKEAARAYLQPMLSKRNQRSPFYVRFWMKLTKPNYNDSTEGSPNSWIHSFANRMYEKLSQAFEGLLEGFYKPHWFALLCVPIGLF